MFTELNSYNFYFIVISLGFYYSFSKTFVYQSLLNLTPGRLTSLENLPIHLRADTIESFSIYITFFLCAIIFYELYNLQKGKITQSRYNLRIQGLAIVIFSPFISYLLLHVLWLKQTDSSWDFDIDFMNASMGKPLTNQWPFDIQNTDPRWTFYRVGLLNSLRVVFVSIILSTLLGILIGVLRLSSNKLLSSLAKTYVDLFRNLPLLVQLFLVSVWFVTTLDSFREINQNNLFGWIFWSNRGFVFPKIVIEEMSFFLAAIGLLLFFRVYIRFTERIFLEKSGEISQPSKNLTFVSIDDIRIIIENFVALLKRPFSYLDKKFEPVISDLVFSFSILLFLFSMFRVLEWNYSFSFNGILSLESFSILILSIFLLIYSSIITSNLDSSGLNTFTEDSTLEARHFRMQMWALVIFIVIILFYLSITVYQPNLITEKNGQELAWGNWDWEKGTFERVSSMFLTLMIGLTLYTAAQIAEIVRGSIQSLSRGQIEAAISIGLSRYQRLKLIILPLALRSMIPSLTNQYLNCWKNSSLAILVGFSDFYSILSNIVNNAGHAVPVFIIVLITYQSGSLVISTIMNYTNNSVTKVKI